MSVLNKMMAKIDKHRIIFMIFMLMFNHFNLPVVCFHVASFDTTLKPLRVWILRHRVFYPSMLWYKLMSVSITLARKSFSAFGVFALIYCVARGRGCVLQRGHRPGLAASATAGGRRTGRLLRRLGRTCHW